MTPRHNIISLNNRIVQQKVNTSLCEHFSEWCLMLDEVQANYNLSEFGCDATAVACVYVIWFDCFDFLPFLIEVPVRWLCVKLVTMLSLLARGPTNSRTRVPDHPLLAEYALNLHWHLLLQIVRISSANISLNISIFYTSRMFIVLVATLWLLV
jgi:hypothetical protein